ncbi:MAG: VOC family protein [Burkholderiales bacterium]|nr:VOC family protein [Burkholderiales bacterium]
MSAHAITTDAPLRLDHVGAIVGDLAAAALRWERLGFTLSPLSRQRGAVPGQSGMQPWATANRCAIFGRGYLELIGTVDANAYQPWTRFLARFQGLHLLALRCHDAAAAYARLAPKAAFLDPPVERERNLVYRGEARTMRFRNIFSRDALCPEGRYIVIEHQTPELLWQPELMRHDNGAVALDQVILVSDDPKVAARAQALDGVAQVLATRAFAERFDWSAPAPCIGAITVAFADLDYAVGLLGGRGIAPRRRGEELWLDPADTNGFVMRLTQHA